MWTLCALWHGGAVSICLSYACSITSVTKLCNIWEDREISKKKSLWSSSWVSHLDTKTIYREQQSVTAVREAEQGVALVPSAKKSKNYIHVSCMCNMLLYSLVADLHSSRSICPFFAPLYPFSNYFLVCRNGMAITFGRCHTAGFCVWHSTLAMLSPKPIFLQIIICFSALDS